MEIVSTVFQLFLTSKLPFRILLAWVVCKNHIFFCFSSVGQGSVPRGHLFSIAWHLAPGTSWRRGWMDTTPPANTLASTLMWRFSEILISINLGGQRKSLKSDLDVSKHLKVRLQHCPPRFIFDIHEPPAV